MITKSMGTGTSTFAPMGTSPTRKNRGAERNPAAWGVVYQQRGAFSANSGATLQFADIVTLFDGTKFDGDGTMDIAAGGVWTWGTKVTVDTGNLAFDGEQARRCTRGDCDLTVNSEIVTWNGGNLGALTGKMTLAEGSDDAHPTAGSHGLAMNLDQYGTVNLGADLTLSGATVTIEPDAEFNILTDNGIKGQWDHQQQRDVRENHGRGISDPQLLRHF